MQDDSVAAVNKLVGTPAKLVLTMGKKSDTYEQASRCTCKIAAGQLTLIWSNDWTGYQWGDCYLEKTICAMPNVAVNPDYAGGWTISQLRTIKEKKEEIESAQKAVTEKLGSDWKMDIDFESFAKNIPKDSSYREDAGKTIVANIVTQWVENDLNKMDEDVTSAANELSGGKHVVKFRMGPKTGTYKINNRINVTCDENNGLVIEWSGDWAGYQLQSDYVNQWVLSNA
jgi:hypothetical protein